MNIIALPNGNHFDGRAGLAPRWIILHGTAGGTSAQAVARYFKSTEGGGAPVSSHYVIGTDGEIVQCVSEQDGAWANGYLSDGHDAWWGHDINPNLLTISIEHCKTSNDNSDEVTPAQQTASFALIRAICQRTGIPARAADAHGGITGHFSIDPVNRRNCPGPYPWAALWTYLQGAKTMTGIPAGWQDDGKTLLAPNGFRVVDGFRQHILSTTWDATNQPIENECHVTKIELHNETLGAGQRQLFRDTMLYWTPATNVQVSFVGLELEYAYTLIGTNQQTIVRQQKQIQELQNREPAPAPTPAPTINLDDVAAVLLDLRDNKAPAIKTAGEALVAGVQRALADIGKA